MWVWEQVEPQMDLSVVDRKTAPERSPSSPSDLQTCRLTQQRALSRCDAAVDLEVGYHVGLSPRGAS